MIGIVRTFILAATLMAFAAPAHAEATLRSRIETEGPAITLGDVFEDAGAASGRAIAPAPAPGQITTLSARVVAAAAGAAGLAWSPPAGLTEIRVVRPGGARATLPAMSGGGRSVADAAVRRGETVSLIYAAPGMQLAARARALEDGAAGQTIRLINLQSNRTIDAVVTGPGAARVAAN